MGRETHEYVIATPVPRMRTGTELPAGTAGKQKWGSPQVPYARQIGAMNSRLRRRCLGQGSTELMDTPELSLVIYRQSRFWCGVTDRMFLSRNVHMLKSSSQRDNISRRDLWEVISRESGAFRNGIRLLVKETQRALSPLPACKDTARQWPPVNQKWVLTRHGIHLHLGLGCPSLQSREN